MQPPHIDHHRIQAWVAHQDRTSIDRLPGDKGQLPQRSSVDYHRERVVGDRVRIVGDKDLAESGKVHLPQTAVVGWDRGTNSRLGTGVDDLDKRSVVEEGTGRIVGDTELLLQRVVVVGGGGPFVVAVHLVGTLIQTADTQFDWDLGPSPAMQQHMVATPHTVRY